MAAGSPEASPLVESVAKVPAPIASTDESTQQAYGDRVKSLIPLSLKKLIKDYLLPNQSVKTKHK